MGLRGIGARPKPAAGTVKRRTRPKWQCAGLTRADRVICFVESLEITSGAHAGRKFILRDWQREIIQRWYATDESGKRIVRTGLLTVPRKSGKTTLIAALALAHLCGPESEARGQVIAAASDRDQSGIIFDELVAWIEGTPTLDERCNIRRHEKVIEDMGTKSRFRALSSDAKKAHGLSPSVVIMDELAQWGDGVGRRLYEALISATGARAEPLTVVISTQAADDSALMSELVDRGQQVLDGVIADQTFAPFIFRAPDDADIWSEATWHACNPALGDFRSLEEMRSFAQTARELPSQEAIFRNLYLNQRVAANVQWIGRRLWLDCAAEIDETALVGHRCYGGLDLGSVRDLTSFGLFFPDTGSLLSWSWCPADGIRERAEADRGHYALWAKLGWLQATEGRATDKRRVALDLADINARFKPVAIAYDRWGITEIERILSEEGIALPLTEWGQGFKDMGPATAAFEELVLNKRLKHGQNPLLTWAISHVALEKNAAGGAKPTKERSRDRIDPVVAAIMAVGLAARAPQPRTYDFSRPLVLSA